MSEKEKQEFSCKSLWGGLNIFEVWSRQDFQKNLTIAIKGVPLRSAFVLVFKTMTGALTLTVSQFSAMGCHPSLCTECSRSGSSLALRSQPLGRHTMHVTHGTNTWIHPGCCTGMQACCVYLAVTWQPVPVKMHAGHGLIPTKLFCACIPVPQIYGVCSALVLGPQRESTSQCAPEELMF